MQQNLDKTMAFKKEDFEKQDIKQLLGDIKDSLEERGYNAINQISGYLITSDPAYISSHKGARTKIQSVERYEIIEELVRFYLSHW